MAAGREDETTVALADVFGALAHPVRIRVLRQFDAGAKLSASRLEDAMPDVALGTLSYHVRKLAGAGLLKPAGRVQRRGAIEHFYLLTPQGASMASVLQELPGRL